MRIKRLMSFVLALCMCLTVISVMTVNAQAGTALYWPVPGHTSRSRGYSASHQALDISDGSISGATIIAAMGGKVTRVSKCTSQHYGSYGDCGGTGTGVVILGDDGRYYSYAHMKAGSIPSNVYVGAYVSAGKKIGQVGTTGNSSGYHLHFSIATGSNYLDNRIDPAKETYIYTDAGDGVTFSALSSKMSVSDTDAVIAMKLNKPSGTTASKYGANLYNQYGVKLGSVSDTSSGYTSSTYIDMWWTVSSGMGVTLSPGRTYQFEFWVTVDGVTYTSDKQSFTTTGTAAYTINYFTNYSQKNFLFDSAFENGLNSNWKSRDTSVYTLSVDPSVTHNGFNSLKIVGTAAGGSGKDLAISTATNASRYHNEAFGDAKSMVLSFWAKSSVNGSKMYIRWGYESTSAVRSVTLSTEWAYYTISLDKTVVCGNVLHPYFDKAGTVWLAEMQLENGTEPTSFVNETGTFTSVTIYAGGTYGTQPVPEREGYIFDGWYTDNADGTLTSAEDKVSAFNRRLYAHWTQENLECVHEYTTHTIPATCQDFAKLCYTCNLCGESYEVYAEENYTLWDEVYPEEVDSSLIETKTEYRHSDYETVTSYETAMEGYSLVSSEWVQSGSGTVKYVRSWPAGFSTSHNLYTTYKKTAKTASETETDKLVINSDKVSGYIYWHWCRGSYTAGPINRKVSDEKTSEYSAFHAFFSTTVPSTLNSTGTTVYQYENSSCCKDSYWYYALPVYTQSYTTYKNLFTYGRWSDWSDWSETVCEESDTCQVETRTLYRAMIGQRAEHSWDAGTVTTEVTCTQEGLITYACTVCPETKVASIEATGHSFAEGSCTVCGDIDPTYNAITAVIQVESVTAAPGETVTVPVTIADNPGFAGFTFTVSYDSENLTLRDVAKGAVLLESTTGTWIENAAGSKISWTDTQNSVGDGVLMYLTFQISENAEPGEYDVAVAPQNGSGSNFVDADAVAKQISFISGRIVISESTAVVDSGWSGSTTWVLNSDGTLVFSGSGNMKNYGYNRNQPWLAYADLIKSIVIEEGVAAIGTGAFMDLTRLESITLPETGLKTIGEAAFYGCSALKEICIPDSVYTVFDYTFKGCTALENVTFSKILIKIGQGAFENCTSLDYVYIPTNVGIIGSWSFKGCTGLVEADMTWADATKIREGAFKNCSALTTIHLPGNIQILGDSCFYGIGATSFTVPDTVTTVEPWCFARAYSLSSITFEGDAPAIGEGAFNKITLTAYYDGGNATWTSAIMQNYGGTVTWEAK